MFYDERKNKRLNNNWSGSLLAFNLWEESKAPLGTREQYLDEIELTEDEISGILSDRIIGICSSCLAKCPGTSKYALITCNLSEMNLFDISALSYHQYLRFINISHNHLEDLSSLGNLRYLYSLNASYNKIKEILNFIPPPYLTDVNLSHNKIKFIRDISKFWSIVKLNLSHNKIEKITGLHNLRYLKNLNLSYNIIECVENLDGLSIKKLNLEYNCVTSFVSTKGGPLIKSLLNLRKLLLGFNKISSLKFLEDTYNLRSIDLKFNKIADLLEVSYLKGHPIYQLDLRGNSCTSWPHYMDLVLFSLPRVAIVDGSEISVLEKVAAKVTYDPPIDLYASDCLGKLILLQQLNFSRINDNVIPYDQQDPPLVILSGPSASKKILMGLQIAAKLFKKVKYCPSYTTREFSTSNAESNAYKFVEREEFNEMARKGEFLTLEELVGDNYGFHESEIGLLEAGNKIGITQMDLQASIQMKIRYPRIKLILVLVKDEKTHGNWIREKFKIFTWIKDSVENLLALTIGVRSPQTIQESETSQMKFASELVDEIVDSLDLPSDLNNLQPQGIGYASTHILHSQTSLPEARKIHNKVELKHSNTKHITFGDKKIIDDSSSISAHDSGILKVMLDEEKNIFIEDEEFKKKVKRKDFCVVVKLWKKSWIMELI